MKQSLLRFLRTMKLLSLMEFARGAVLRVRWGAANRAFTREHPAVQLPPARLMLDPYGIPDYREYWDSGRSTAQRIAELATLMLHELSGRPMRILDWGCGPARVARHLVAQRGLEGSVISACDYDVDTVEWARSSIKGVSFFSNRLNPPLPFSDEAFDLIYGISIFTHLSAELHAVWINELYRVLAQGGLLLLTFQGSHYRPKLLQNEVEVFDAGRIVIRGRFEEGKRLFCAFHPEPFVRGLFDQRFEKFTFFRGDVGSIAPPQDTVVVKKKTALQG